MASTIYTQTLWSLAGTSAPYPIAGPVPAAGFLWVVRDVVLQSPQGVSYLGQASPSAVTINGIPIAATPPFGTMGGCVFRWTDLRQVVSTSDELFFTGGQDGWFLRVAGYQLTAP